MLAYLTRRILLGIISIWVITIISFAIIQLPPGDFITGMYFQGDTGILPTELEMEALRDRWGLNRPWIVQYTTWMSRVVRGDFGFSVEYQTPVRKVLGDRWVAYPRSGRWGHSGHVDIRDTCRHILCGASILGR